MCPKRVRPPRIGRRTPELTTRTETALSEDLKFSSLQSMCPERLVDQLELQAARCAFLPLFVSQLHYKQSDCAASFLSAQGGLSLSAVHACPFRCLAEIPGEIHETKEAAEGAEPNGSERDGCVD